MGHHVRVGPILLRFEYEPMSLRRWLLAFTLFLLPLASARADDPRGLTVTFIDVEGEASPR